MTPTNTVLLHELNISYPPVEKLPATQGNWHLAKLVQYPAKTPMTTDENGRMVAGDIIPGQFKVPEHSTFFQNTVSLFGKVIQARTWSFGSRPDDKATYATVPLDSLSEQEMLDAINDGHTYIYLETESLPSGRLNVVSTATIEEYKAIVQPTRNQTPVPQPSNQQTPSTQPTAN